MSNEKKNDSAPMASGNCRPIDDSKAKADSADRMSRSLVRDIKPTTGPAVPLPKESR